jgi:DNA-binding PadR family transcriptional regulator
MAWHAQYSQIYPELYRMAALGLITVVAGALDTGASTR